MFIQQFFIPGIAHSSYLVGAESRCIIIDPTRDVERYLDAAAELNLAITHVLETHLHADFVSGHMELAETTGAAIYAPASGDCAFDHIAVADGSSFKVEELCFSVLDTPGHTPDGVTYVVADTARGPEPAAAFTGDALFVGDVGRPDLFPGRSRELAGMLFDNLHKKVLALPDGCLLFPAHGAGSLCGRAMGAMRYSTIGYERQYNAALKVSDREEFITSLTQNMPPAPDHFSRCSDINRQGPALVRTLPEVRPLRPAEFQARAETPGSVILSVRDVATFGGAHIPGSIHIDIASNFSTFAGWVLPPDDDILLVADSPAEVKEAVLKLRRVGLDRTIGYLVGGTHAWSIAGYPIDHVRQLSPSETHDMVTSGKAVLVDVRFPDEFEDHHLEGAVNIPAMDLRTRHPELPSDRPLIVMCRTGQRSSLASSLLKRAGFAEVYNAAGGVTGYLAAGFS
ncbi:MAG: rhodanese-like domain-containing protein [Methanoregulaceae archaeon]